MVEVVMLEFAVLQQFVLAIGTSAQAERARHPAATRGLTPLVCSEGHFNFACGFMPKRAFEPVRG